MSYFVDRARWSEELVAALVVTAFGAVLGGAVGVLWHAKAPKVAIIRAVNGSADAMTALVGADLWLGFLGVIAGIVCVALLRLVGGRVADGPGAQLGLAAGGLLGMLVAARVGHMIGRDDLGPALRAAFPGATPKGIANVLGLFDLSLRMKAMLFGWPLAAVVLNVVIVAVRLGKEPPRAVVSAYPGSS